MKRLLISNLVRPLIARLGTAGAVLLVNDYGFDGALVEQFVISLSAAALIAVDLWISRKNREVEIARVQEGD